MRVSIKTNGPKNLEPVIFEYVTKIETKQDTIIIYSWYGQAIGETVRTVLNTADYSLTITN